MPSVTRFPATRLTTTVMLSPMISLSPILRLSTSMTAILLDRGERQLANWVNEPTTSSYEKQSPAVVRRQFHSGRSLKAPNELQALRRLPGSLTKILQLASFTKNAG